MSACLRWAGAGGVRWAGCLAEGLTVPSKLRISASPFGWLGRTAPLPSRHASSWLHSSNVLGNKPFASTLPNMVMCEATSAVRGSLRLMGMPVMTSNVRGERAQTSAAPKAEIQSAPAEPPAPKDVFFVVKINGKQHKVCEYDTVTTDNLVGKKVGIGTPLVQGATAEAIVEQVTLGPKVYILKKKRRKNQRRFRGFRAAVTSIRIMKLNPPEA